MKQLFGAILLSLLVTAIALLSRPIMPIDETRYVGVAWEAHATGDYLVSHLNGATYAHKPPLLFWLINAVWSIFGVNELGARIVGPLAGILCLPLLRWISLKLWPSDIRTANFAPFILASFTVWLLFAPLTMFDTLLTLATLVSISGMINVRMGKKLGWLIVGLGMGLGILTKGPVIFVHTLPIAILGYWWARKDRAASMTVPTESGSVDSRSTISPVVEADSAKFHFGSWYLGVIVATLLAGVIGLSWAIPSAMSGGEAYANELLWGQTAGRVTKSFSHRQPFYWYLPILPLCMLPWLIVGTIWRGLRLIQLDWGLRFLLCWVGAPLLILSLISGKQVHYMMPMFPALALIIAKLLSSTAGQKISKTDAFSVAIGTVIVACVPLVFNHLDYFRELGLAEIVPDLFVPVLIAAGLIIYFLCRQTLQRVVYGLASMSAVTVSLFIIAGSIHFWDGFSVKELSDYFAKSKSPILWYGEYHSQLNFAGRMSRIDAALTDQQFYKWIEKNDGGIVVTRLSSEGEYGRKLASTEHSQIDHQPTEFQKELIAEILSQKTEFANLKELPKPVSIFWIRKGLKKKPYVALCIEPGSLPTSTAAATESSHR